MIQRSNGFVPTQSNIYLRDWSLKHELRNRAMIYDNDNLIRETKVSVCVFFLTTDTLEITQLK